MRHNTLRLKLGNKISLIRTFAWYDRVLVGPCHSSACRTSRCKSQARLSHCSQVFPVSSIMAYICSVHAHQFEKFCSARIRIATLLSLALPPL
jgi:hypothetical protein